MAQSKPSKKIHILNLVGQRFGQLSVLEEAGRSLHFKTLWRCQCDCGNIIVAVGGSLKSGNTKSCGCLKRDVLRVLHRKHGMSQMAEYGIWAGMLKRCRNKNVPYFHRYGGRGISVCDRWLFFETFLKDVGPRPSPRHMLDRISNDGDYEPGNVRWVTSKESNRNRCNNRLLTYGGDTKTLAEWAERTGLPYHTLKARLSRYGWSLERAMATPVDQGRSQRIVEAYRKKHPVTP